MVTAATQEKLLSVRQVCEMTCLPRSSLYVLMRRGEFPEPIRVSQKTVRWKLTEVEAWISSRTRARGYLAEAQDRES